ncbi:MULTISPECIES: response regulator transcription factor [Paenibacillus]|uniref:response regulator transcription factor n=1 Tax=Paenibacillus TaxID=44249 RepID=UPI00097AFE1A|nr:helix-turn-helix domain-containing protein [Paenibacillus macerans]MED4957916.1 AraC family transcriptional regulator [Paenibacillus macerans]OMG48640.1 DNA-binding response regulator [Paenibacillus macerans]
MYRLLIADDEALEREGLELTVERAMPGVFRFMHAGNGRMAIECAEEHRPHIAMLDINMPGIGGLEALRELKERLPDTRFVLVTAYDYFAYAREALSLGVKEYILKPAKREMVVGTLKRLIDEIEREKRGRKEELELRHKISQLMPLAENELALMLMVDQTVDSSASQLSEWLDFRLDRGSAIVAAFESYTDEQDKKKIYDHFRSYVKTHGPDSLVSSLIDHHIAVFLRKPPATGDNGWRQLVECLVRQLHDLARQQLGIQTAIGIGSLHSGEEGFRKSYFEAVFASTLHKQGEGYCRFDELQPSEAGNASLLAVEAAKGIQQQTYVMSALQRLREQREVQTLSVLARAKLYIEERFTDDLSLEEVADYVHLNAHYFSKIFKQEYGETFIDFVTRLRIDKAISLIKAGNLTLKEVSFEVGYKDPNYFSRVFKKIMGVPPTEFKGQK